MSGVVLQRHNTSHEVRSVLAHALQTNLRLVRSDMAGLVAFAAELEQGTLLPVGSVEFVQAAMRCAGVPEPANMSYPPALQAFLLRDVGQIRIDNLRGRVFVKPVATKVFEGFIHDVSRAPADEFNLVQAAALRDLASASPTALVWVSDVVAWQAEWRYYVDNAQVIGCGRYDPDGAEDAPMPDAEVIGAMIDAFGETAPYALDVGVLGDGRTALVEVNDAWAIGLYCKALSAAVYIAWLRRRWQMLVDSSTTQS